MLIGYLMVDEEHNKQPNKTKQVHRLALGLVPWESSLSISRIPWWTHILVPSMTSNGVLVHLSARHCLTSFTCLWINIDQQMGRWTRALTHNHIYCCMFWNHPVCFNSIFTCSPCASANLERMPQRQWSLWLMIGMVHNDSHWFTLNIDY